MLVPLHGHEACTGHLTEPKGRTMTDRPEIVCICGSSRFVAEIRAANRALSLAGAMVLAPCEDDGSAEQLTAEQIAQLGGLHRRKIDLADRILVVNPGGYIGETNERSPTHGRSASRWSSPSRDRSRSRRVREMYRSPSVG